MRIAQRIQALPTYVFATLGKRIRALKAQGVDVLRLDIGNPDMAPPPQVVDTMVEAVQRSDIHGYPSSYGEPYFREAVADYYARRFGVKLDPETEVLALVGSKEGLAHTPIAFVDPGTVVLVPDPGYPVYSVSVSLVGGEIYRMPLLRENDFFPAFEAIPEAVLSKARMMWLNYPNNPTAAVAGLPALHRAVDFARQHDLLLVYDNPYCEITWDGVIAPSILQIEGAREVAVEFNSLSKTMNMAGWRVGMAVGSAEALAALARVKTNMDTGVFRAIQEAATAALHLPVEWFEERNAVYRRRRAVVTRALDRMRLWYTSYTATIYVWSEAPPMFTSAEFAAALLEETGVSVAPGTAFGPNGEGYVRICLVQSEDRLEEAMERWERWLVSKAAGIPLDHPTGTVGNSTQRRIAHDES